jgi:hypothetical protein
MPFTQTAIASVVVCLAASSLSYADQGSRRGQGHGGRVVVSPGVVVRPPVAVPRHAVPRGVPPHGGYYGAQWGYRPVYRPGLGFGIYIGSPYVHGVVGYGHPYYARPYPYWYGYGYSTPFPYAYAYPPAIPYPAYAGTYAVPSTGALYGGVRLEVAPHDAAVYVDGYYAGIVEDFDGAWERVALAPGPHRFEITAPGLETLSFDVNVRPSETIRYRGEMLRVAP